MDGGVSMLLAGNGDGTFRAVPAKESGVMVKGDAVAVTKADLNHDGLLDLVFSRNDGAPEIFLRNKMASDDMRMLKIKGEPGNPNALGARIVMEFKDGRKRVAEIAGGGGYLSQSPSIFHFLLPDIASIRVIWRNGASQVLDSESFSGKNLHEVNPPAM